MSTGLTPILLPQDGLVSYIPLDELNFKNPHSATKNFSFSLICQWGLAKYIVNRWKRWGYLHYIPRSGKPVLVSYICLLRHFFIIKNLERLSGFAITPKGTSALPSQGCLCTLPSGPYATRSQGCYPISFQPLRRGLRLKYLSTFWRAYPLTFLNFHLDCCPAPDYNVTNMLLSYFLKADITICWPWKFHSRFGYVDWWKLLYQWLLLSLPTGQSF